MKGSKSSSDAKGLELTAGLAMAGAEENEVIHFLAVFDTPLPNVGILTLIYLTSTF